MREIGFNTRVILTACHDTASAFMAIEPKEEDAVYLSSGTWSLPGVELDAPVTSADSLREGFTNGGAAAGKSGICKTSWACGLYSGCAGS